MNTDLHIGLGWEEQLATETGTTDKELTLSAVLFFIDLSGAFSIHAKTC